MQQLEDLLRVGQVAQRVLAQVAQAGSSGQRVPGEILRGRERSTWPPWPAASRRARRFSAGAR